MTIYNVTSTVDPVRDTLAHCVAGSYTRRCDALDACVKLVFEHMNRRSDFMWAMAHDENHPDAEQFFVTGRDGMTRVRRGFVKPLRAFLRDELGGQGCYYVHDGESSWHFDVSENELEGELWHTVTWGDSDTEDPNFTTPWPESFTSQETAVKTFVDYARDLFKSRGLKFGGVEKAIRKSLADDGKVQVDLNDGCCVSCVLYHDDAKNIKE